MLPVRTVLPVLLFIVLLNAESQPIIDSTGNNCITMAIGYKSAGKRIPSISFGTHWRYAWTTPVEQIFLNRTH